MRGGAGRQAGRGLRGLRRAAGLGVCAWSAKLGLIQAEDAHAAVGHVEPRRSLMPPGAHGEGELDSEVSPLPLSPGAAAIRQLQHLKHVGRGRGNLGVEALRSLDLVRL